MMLDRSVYWKSYGWDNEVRVDGGSDLVYLDWRPIHVGRRYGKTIGRHSAYFASVISVVLRFMKIKGVNRINYNYDLLYGINIGERIRIVQRYSYV